MDYYGIAQILSREHPQTIAVALNRLEPDSAAEIIRNMPRVMQADLIARMSRVGDLPPEILSEIDAMLAPLLKP